MAHWFNSPERKEFLDTKMKMHFEGAKEHYGADRVWVTMLYGSQNYHLDTPESDVDVKTMLLPTPRDVVLGKKMVSVDLQAEDLSLNNVKDYRGMFQNYMKGNVNFLETLYTPHYLLSHRSEWRADLFKCLRAERDLVAHSQPQHLMRMAAAMADQKYHAMEHRYAGKVTVLEKYGYDPKQLHHLCRLPVFMRDFMTTGQFGVALFPNERTTEFLLKLKTDPLPLAEARELKEEAMTEVNRLVAVSKKELPEYNNRQAAQDFMDELAVQVFERFQEESFVAKADVDLRGVVK